MSVSMSVSLIVPAYEEGHHIYDNLIEINKNIFDFCEDYEIIVVDDGSSDSTADEAKRAAEECKNITVISCRENGGKGKAVRIGFKNASKDLITYIDADLDIPPRQIECLFQTMLESSADVVIQSKRHPESVVNGFPLKRRILSNGYILLAKKLFRLPVSDTQVGIKLYKREVLEKIEPKLMVNRYAFDIEQLVLAHRHKYAISESPVHIEFKAEGDNMRIKDIFHIARDTLSVFYRLNISKEYDSDDIDHHQHDDISDVRVDHLG